MAVTVDFIGRRIADASSVTNWSVERLVGAGGGTWDDPPILDTEDFVQGTSSVKANGAANNNQEKPHMLAYDYQTASGAALDFTTTEAGKLIFMWAKAASPVGTGINEVGLGICLSSNTPTDSVSAIWNFYKAENYPGGWVRMVCDPINTTPSFSGASFDLSNVAFIGPAASTTITRDTDLLWCDAIDIGSGINVYGNGDTDDVITEISNISENDTNRFGCLEALEVTNTVYVVRGLLSLGDSAGTNNTAITGTNSILVIDQPQHTTSYESLSLTNSIPDDFPKVVCEGNTTGSTNITFGIKVAGDTADEDTGRNGLVFLGNNAYNIDFNFNKANVDSLNMYGSTIRNFQPTGGLIWDAVSNHDFVGSFLDNSAKLTPDSGVRIRNSTFLNHPSGIGPTGEADAALLFKTSPPDTEISDIVNSSFVSNFYAVEHAESGEYTYDALSFSANDFDIYYSYTGVGDLIINATNGSTPTTVATGNPSNTVNIINAVTLTLEDVRANSEVRFYTSGTKTERYGVENSPDDGDGFGSVAFNYEFGDPGVDIRIFHLDYQPVNLFARSLGSTNASIPIQQIPDRNYENP